MNKMDLDIKPQSHLINILKSTSDHHPNFTVFLGAGASVSSGVKLASEMINDWRVQHFEMYKENETQFSNHFHKFNWFQRPEEYSVLFETLYDQPSQRREYIESCINKSFPSWGYIYLVNLISKGVFNTLFTTNFDDLLNEACYQFSSNVRPIVCAHDSSIKSIRITSNRPKLIKLHGDFLFDDIKNTLRELESLEKNTIDKFKQYASEFGFIVLGYSGCDRSIMDTFNTLLKFDDYFPNGIYWCVRKGDTPNQSVINLSRFPKFKLIEIEGFDEFFAELNNALSLPLQEEMINPYGALARKLNKLTQAINLPTENIHPVIEKDISKLGSQIQKLENFEKEKPITIETGLVKDNLPIPYGLLSNIRTREGDFKLAFDYRLKEIETDPSTNAFIQALDLMFKSERIECKDKLINLIKTSSIFKTYPHCLNDVSLVFIRNNDYEIAKEFLEIGREWAIQSSNEYWNEEIYFLNLIQIKKHKNESFSTDDIIILNKLASIGSNIIKMGANILLDNYELAEEQLIAESKRQSVRHMNDWPIMSFLKPYIKDISLKRTIN